MFARKLFGTRKVATPEEPPPADATPTALNAPRLNPDTADRRRRTIEPDERIFDASLFEGDMGDVLRRHGYAPDDPHNMVATQEPVSAQLAEGQARLRETLAGLNRLASSPVFGVYHLLPPTLWHGRYGAFLLHRLDLTPYAPWNSIFLPLNPAMATELRLPLMPAQDDDIVGADVEDMMAMIADLFDGRSSPEAEALASLCASIRRNFPALFPPDRADYSDNVRDARANVRAFAVMHAATRAVEISAIIASQRFFLGRPEEQLIA